MMLTNAKNVGVDVLAWHPESGKGQFEYALGAVDALTACDNQVRFKETVDAAAKTHGLRACWLPKPDLMVLFTFTPAYFHTFTCQNSCAVRVLINVHRMLVVAPMFTSACGTAKMISTYSPTIKTNTGYLIPQRALSLASYITFLLFWR